MKLYVPEVDLFSIAGNLKIVPSRSGAGKLIVWSHSKTTGLKRHLFHLQKNLLRFFSALFFLRILFIYLYIFFLKPQNSWDVGNQIISNITNVESRVCAVA